MTAFSALTISRPAFLKALDWATVQGFLKPFAAYLAARGFDLETPPDDGGYSALGDILARPGADTPNALLDALFITEETAHGAAPDDLHDDARRLGIALPSEATMLETVLRIWNAAPDAIRTRHMELTLAKVRTFEFYNAEDERALVRIPSEAALKTVTTGLDEWFDKRRRGRGCQIRLFQRDTELWFLISHGELFRRVGTWEDGKSGSLGYRPDKYDVVVYDELTKELRVNATLNLRDLYRRQFGILLFGTENHFPGENKYTLEPLRELGEKSLICADVPGLNWVKLTRLTYELKGDKRIKRTDAAENLFESYDYQKTGIPPGARLMSASFSVRFKDNPRPRTVTIKPTNVALYTRDGDSHAIDEWLMRRGFIQQRKVAGYAQTECVLAIA